MSSFRLEVAAHSTKSFALTPPPGRYRFRTIEAGPEADADIGSDGIIPEITADGSGHSVGDAR